MNDERDEIRRRIDLVDLVSQRVKLKRSGKNFLGLCPFHDDKTPSFNVSSSTGRYKCFACGESGDVFTWVMKTQGLEFIEALKQLADQAGVTLNLKQTGPRVDRTDRERWLANMQAALIFFRNELQKNPLAKEYLDKRQLPPDVFSEWELGYAPNIGEALTQELRKGGYSLQESRDLFLVDQDGNGGFYDKFRGRLMFPIRDEKGDLVGFGGRILGDGHPKYINSSETPLYHKSRVLYGMHKAKDRIMKDRHAVLVEGYLDVIACHRAGVNNAVASCGTALAEDQVRLLKRYADKVTILYDADTAGQKAALRAIELFQSAELPCRIAMMPGGEDPDTLLNRKGPQAVQDTVKASVSPFDYEILLLEKRLGTASEEFWDELPTLLARSKNELEIEKHLLRYAGQHPQIDNVNAAANALRRQVRSLRQPERRQSVNGGPRKLVQGPTVKQLLPAEAVLFRSFILEHFRPLAWQHLMKESSVITNLAIQVRTSLISSFGNVSPTGSINQWVDRIESPEVIEVLNDLEFDVRVQEINQEFISESIQYLQDKNSENSLGRDRQNLQSEDPIELAEYFRKLKAIKGVDDERRLD